MRWGYYGVCAMLPLLMVGGISVFAQDAERCDAKLCYIEITRDGFVPSDVALSAGSTIVWRNVDERVHAVSIYNQDESLLFNSTLLKSGDVFQFTFSGNTFARYRYFDEASTGLAGEIRVGPQPYDTVKSIKVDFTNPGSGVKSIFLSRGNVTSVELLPESTAMQVGVSADGDDTLRIKLDRKLFDSRLSGRDAPFNVTADGQQAPYTDIATSAERVAYIPIPQGATTIRVVGTHMSTELLGYDRAIATLEEADTTIGDYRDKGVIISEADDLLLQARNAFGAGKYTFAEELAKEAIQVAHSASRAANAASRAMGEAEASIRTTKTLGLDVLDAEEILMHTKEKYSYGGYGDALNMAVQARIAAASKSDQIVLLGAVGASALGGFAYLYRRTQGKKQGPVEVQPLPVVDQPLDLERAFIEKPHLRSDDRQVLQYIVGRGGEVLLAEIRNDFGLPKSSAWRLVKRLEREELIDIIKFGNQNLIRCRQKAKD
ncbi:MAG: DUF7343 domain-containing protein [Nitrososphaera sp.]|uniref:DUF7343 domain-containing protein n=1 Tax=Nitrososphaera sp. TaxID=1971748 RepID=UPI003D6EC5AC